MKIDLGRTETNIVLFEVPQQSRPASEIVGSLRERGVLINAVGPTTYRAVTHLDVSANDIDRAAEVFSAVLAT